MPKRIKYLLIYFSNLSFLYRTQKKTSLQYLIKNHKYIKNTTIKIELSLNLLLIKKTKKYRIDDYRNKIKKQFKMISEMINYKTYRLKIKKTKPSTSNKILNILP